MHSDQVDIDAATVRSLVAEQFPQWVGLEVRPVESTGTVNAIYRIGEDLSARFPLRREDPDALRRTLEREAAAAAELAEASPVPAPRPIALGRPGTAYPMPWAVQTWLDGTVATRADPSASLPFGQDVGELVAALRRVDPRGRHFTGGGRGGDLSDHDAWMETCFRRSEDLLDVAPLRRMWAQLRGLPRPGPDVMCHGDLIPGNVLVRDGRLAGVLDGGGFGPADAALDLVAAWHLLDHGPRRVMRDVLGSGELEWQRGRAWALEQAMGLVWYYVDTNPTMAAMGRHTLSRLLSGD